MATASEGLSGRECRGLMAMRTDRRVGLVMGGDVALTWQAFLWQLMRFNMLQLLKNLRFHSQGQGKEMTDADILNWANNKVKSTGRNSQMDSFKYKSLSMVSSSSNFLVFVEPRVVKWSVVTKGEDDEEKKLNATYIISVARKLGCSIFLLPRTS
ncbi:hypothetical protein Syun_011932 [Stephania yunnanensis]|uniref:Uncharacterized protein n=1 Tax=Stephania yunnanensis TaxID=152371 RepID=A0AAP0K0Y2_9MAGN